MDSFDLQVVSNIEEVANCCNNSRLVRFLYSSDPKKRYELFLKATQLDIINKELQGSFEQLETEKGKLAAYQEISEDLKREYDELTPEISRLNSPKVTNILVFMLYSVAVVLPWSSRRT